MITPLSTNPEVTKAGDYVFRVCFTDDFQGKIMTAFAHDDSVAAAAVILTNITSYYSMELARYFEKTAREKGIKILWEGKYKEKVTDFSEIVMP